MISLMILSGHYFNCMTLDIQGDGHIFSIAAASIIAKVTRDRIMIELDKKYPMYGLAKHKVSAGVCKAS